MTDDIVMSTSSRPSEPPDDTEYTFSAREIADVFDVPAAKPLGRGSFGETWRLDLPDGTHQAAKILLSPNYSKSRLEREIVGLRRVDSPNVVKLLGTTEVSVADGSRSVLLFEFVPGGDANSRLQPGTVVDPLDVARCGHGVFNGLVALHNCDTVHRDIKPANIAFRDGDWGQSVLLDLGLARVLDQESITTYPALMGTAPYMAPEQLRGERARKAADVFATGVVLHVLLAGAHPFYAGSNEVTLREAVALIDAGPQPLPETVPHGLADLVQRFLHPGEAERGSARRACRDLARLGFAA